MNEDRLSLMPVMSNMLDKGMAFDIVKLPLGDDDVVDFIIMKRVTGRVDRIATDDHLSPKLGEDASQKLLLRDIRIED